MRCLILFAIIAVAAADITLSRTISNVKSGFDGGAVLASGCTSKDAYGSNDCDVKWGSSNSVSIHGDLPEDLNSKAKVQVNLKVDSIFPWDFSCALCGSSCTVTIPVVKKTVTIKLPPCPIKKGALPPTTKKFTVPSKSPTPVGVSAEGTATITDDSGATVATIAAQAKVGPSVESPQAEFIVASPQEPDFNAIADIIANLFGGNVTDVADADDADQPFWAQFMGKKQAGKGGMGGFFDFSKFMKGGAQPAQPAPKGGAFDFSKFMKGGAQPAPKGGAFDFSKFMKGGAQPAQPAQPAPPKGMDFSKFMMPGPVMGGGKAFDFSKFNKKP